jgi:transcriptional regulator with XRE-family HTH domain
MRRRAINQDIMTFAEKIKELLKQHEISQAEFGRLTDVPGTTVGHWINDGMKPNVYAVLRVARAFKLEMDSLVDDEIPGYRAIKPPAPPKPAENHKDLELFRLRDYDELALILTFRDMHLTREQAHAALYEYRDRLKAAPESPQAPDELPGSRQVIGEPHDPPQPPEPRKRRENDRTA